MPQGHLWFRIRQKPANGLLHCSPISTEAFSARPNDSISTRVLRILRQWWIAANNDRLRRPAVREGAEIKGVVGKVLQAGSRNDDVVVVSHEHAFAARPKFSDELVGVGAGNSEGSQGRTVAED